MKWVVVSAAEWSTTYKCSTCGYIKTISDDSCFALEKPRKCPYCKELNHD